MTTIIITTAGGEKQKVQVAGNWSDYEAAVKAHGYDPLAVEWSVDDPGADLLQAIKDASNLQELKDALTNSSHPAQARDRNR